jgi:hypothetical protein
MKEHEGHRLEPLEALGEKYFCQGSMSDPMRSPMVGTIFSCVNREKVSLNR